MSVKDGKTELMPAVQGGQPVADLIPERVTEVHTEPVPVPRELAAASPSSRPAIPHPTAPFLHDARVAAADSDFLHWARKWLEAYAALAEKAVGAQASSSVIAKGRRYARGQDRALGDTEALELGCWLTAAESLDQVEDALARLRPPEQAACAQVALQALAALYVREHGPRP